MSCLVARLIALLLTCAGLAGCGEREEEDVDLVLYCAAGMRGPVAEAVLEFRSETGIGVDIQYGGSGALLASLSLAGGDLFLAADADYIGEADSRGLIGSSFVIGSQVPVLASHEGREFTNLKSWAGSGERIAIALPETAAIGRTTREVLKEVGAWETLEPHAQFVTVYELANAILLGSVGSGIIWDNVAAGYEGMTIQRFPELDGAVSTVKIAVLKESTFPEQAELFAEFLANSPKGRAIFGRYGLRSEEVSQ